MKILVRKLEEIADVIAGQSPPSTTYNDKGEGLPFFQGKTDFGKKHPTTRIWCSEPKKIALPNDILISVRAPVGPVNIANKKSCIGRGLSAIRPKDGNSLDFIFYFLKSNERLIAKNASGSTFRAITQKDLKEIKIPIPEKLEDQIRIANILSRAEALISKRKESIQLLDELLKSTFLDMFGDPVRNEKGWENNILGRYTLMIGSGSTPKGGKDVYQRTGTYFIRSQNIRMNKIDYSDIYCISEDIHNNMKRTWLKNKDVLLNITGASIGRVATFYGDDDSANVNQHVSIIRTKKEYLQPRFLEYQIAHDNFQKKALASSAGGTREAFTFEQIKKFEFILPPIEKQAEFTQIVEKVESIKTKYQESLQELEKLYASLSQKAFKGELDLSKMEVKDYNLGHAEPGRSMAAEEGVGYNNN